MKPNRKNPLLAAAFAAITLALATHSAQAFTYYWDGNNNTANFGSLASATWGAPTVGTATTGWTTDATGATAISGNSITTTITDDVNFGTNTTSRGLGGSTLTVAAGGVNVRSITWGSQTTTSQTISGGPINIGTGSTISVGAGSTTVQTIASNLTGSNGFTKSGNTLALSGSNSGLTGTVNVNTGSLIFRNVAAKTGGTMAFSAGTTLGLGVGGVGFFTSTDVDNAFAGTIAGNLTGMTLDAATNIGIDTSAGNFTYASSVAGAPTRGLTKFGGNTLTLTGANTYTGSTNILGGTLRLENTSAVSGSSSIAVGSGTTLSVGTNTAFSGPGLSLTTANVVSDRQTLGAGLTHVFGNVGGISNSAHNFTAGSNVNTATAAIQVGSITNASGSGGSATLNPTTASLIVTGGYTGATNAGTNNLALSGTSAANSITGDITNGTRVTQTLAKSGTSIWSLSGANTYNGGTTVTGGVLTFRNTGSKSATGIHTFDAASTLGLGVATSGLFFTSTDISNAFAGSMIGNLSNVTVATGTSVGIDTSAGDFTYAAGSGAVTRGLTKLGANKLTLTGLDASAANNYSGSTIINEGTLEITTTSPSFTGGLTIGALAMTGTPGTLDLTSASATFGGNLVVNTNSATASEIKIGAGQTLTLNGAVQIGASAPVINGTITKLNMTGGGAFVHNGSTFVVGGTGAGAGISQDATVDLRALSSATITTSGNFRIAPNTGTNNGSQAAMFLPTPVVADTVATTTITSNGTNGISVGNSGSFTNTQMNTLQLGTGLTRLNAVKVNVGAEQASGNLRDVGQLIFGQAAGDLIIRGADGISAVTSLNVGTGSGSTASTSASPSLFDSSGHDADILVTTLNIGSLIRTAGAQTYQFKFGEGDNSLTGGFSSKLDVTDVNIGSRAAGTSSTTTTTSKLDISGGTVLFGNVAETGTGVDIGNSAYDQAGAATFDSQLNISGGNVTIHEGTGFFAVRLGNSTAANAGIVNASMNLTGGTTTLKGDIHKGTGVGGTVNSTLKISGGTLDMDSHDIGTLSAAITLTAESGTLKNLAELNGGGTLTKTTAGTLIVEGTNGYTGATAVNAGTLAVNGNISTSNITVSGVGSTLQGSGSSGGSVTIGNLGTLASGNSIESLATGALSFTTGSTFQYEIDKSVAPGASGDLTAVTGDLSLAGTVTLSLVELGVSGAWELGNPLGDALTGSPNADKLTLISYTGGWNNGLFTYLGNTVLDDSEILFNGQQWWFNYNDTDAGDNFTGDLTGTSFVTITIPEPRAALLGGLGLLALLRRRR